MSQSELAGRNRSVSGQDRKFPPAPGTNQIGGFREFRPLTSQEKNKKGFFKVPCKNSFYFIFFANINAKLSFEW